MVRDPSAQECRKAAIGHVDVTAVGDGSRAPFP
jgi:hypothetical protein